MQSAILPRSVTTYAANRQSVRSSIFCLGRKATATVYRGLIHSFCARMRFSSRVGASGPAGRECSTSVPALWCIAPHRESFNRCAWRWSIRTDSRYMNTRRHRKMCTRARRITPNAGLVGNCSPIPGILTRPDPPPASKRANRSYEEGPVRVGILGNFWRLSFSTRAMRAHHRAERVPLSALRVGGEEIPKIPSIPTCYCISKS